MLRYEAQIAKIYEDLSPLGKGLIFIETPPGEEEAVFAVMPADLVGERRTLEDVAAGKDLTRAMTIVGLAGPPDRAARNKMLHTLDQWRERFSLGGVRLIVLTDFEGMQAVERHAGSMFSARSYDAVVEFEPDPTITYEEARESLHRHLQEKFGRFNLRGLVRSEGEDVAFRFEDLFQELRVTPTRLANGERLGGLEAGASAGSSDVEKTDDRAETTLKAPEERSARRSSARPGILRVRGQGTDLRVDELPAYFGYWKDTSAPRNRTETGHEQAGADRTVHERRCPPLLILGGPGSGKTSLLRWMALRASKEPTLLGVEAPIPMLMSLADFAASPVRRKLLAHLRQRLLEQRQPAGHILDSALLSGRVIFLFDGLDEVTDDLSRNRIRDELDNLSREISNCLFLVTSRIAGYERPFANADEVMIQRLDGSSIRAFLTSWCTLYAQERVGATSAAWEEGRREGEALSAAVLGTPSVRALAENPLLLTILAIVHRTGVKLPDHRVELYDHITRILVERWNRVRSMEAGEGEAPVLLKSSDAARLLGPLAMRAIEQGDASSMPLSLVRSEIAKVLKSGAVRGFESADQAVRLFRDTLGVLVETGLDQFAFLHLTLGEYFAAWELVRTSALEKIAVDPRKSFDPGYREVLLLAAGILGVMRADDERLGRAVDSLVRSANEFKGADPGGLESILAHLLADDPFLDADHAEKIVHGLVPKYWFGTPWNDSRYDALPFTRLKEGRSEGMLVNAIKQAYQRSSIPWYYSEHHLFDSALCLRELDIDYGLAFIPLIRKKLRSHGQVSELPLPHWGKIQELNSASIRLTVRVSRLLDDHLRSRSLPLLLIMEVERLDGSLLVLETPWPETPAVEENDWSRLYILDLPLTTDHQTIQKDSPVWATLRLSAPDAVPSSQSGPNSMWPPPISAHPKAT